MPAKSQAHRGYIYHEFGPEWAAAHHFNNTGKLPARVGKKPVKKAKKGKRKRG